MAMDYDGANTGVFTHIGKIIKHYNQFADDANDGSTGLAADRKDILDKFQAGDQDVAIDGLVGAYERWKSEYIQRRSTISGFALTRLQDVTTVLDEIGASSASQAEILEKLITQMNADTETVEASAVTLGSVTANGGNTGNGTLLRTKVLDGVNSPGIVDGISMPSHAEYNGLDSELTVPAETWRFRVTGDSFQDGLEEGSEQLSWEGDVADQPHGVDAEGSGFIDTLTPINSAGLLTDGDFEEFTSNTPDNWTIDDGTAGTHIFEETNAANIYHGVAGLKFTGDGSQASIQVSQAIDPASVTANKAYVVTAQVKASASVTNGALTIQFEGTGYTAAGSEKVSIAAGSLPTSFTLQHFFINLPPPASNSLVASNSNPAGSPIAVMSRSRSPTLATVSVFWLARPNTTAPKSIWPVPVGTGVSPSNRLRSPAAWRNATSWPVLAGSVLGSAIFVPNAPVQG